MKTIEKGRLRRGAAVATACAALLVLGACAGPGGGASSTTGDPDTDTEIEFPHRSVEFIVPYAPGGGTDTVSRVFTEFLSEELGVPVAVANVEGASGSVGGTQLFESDPDGAVIGMQADGLVLNPLLNTDLPYSGYEDFDLITEMATVPQVLVTSSSQPFDDLDDVISVAKERPGELGIATSGTGTTSDIAAISLERTGDIEFTRIPQQGGAESRTSVIAGRVEFTIASAGTFLGNIEAGELKPLAVLGPERLAELPDVPTAMEQGYDMAVSSNYYVLAPKGLPDDVLEMLVSAALAATQQPEFQEKVRNLGAVPSGLSPAELSTKLTQVTQEMREIVEYLAK